MENEDKIHVYSEEVRDILSEPPKTIISIGNTIVFGFILVILLLAYVIKYPDIVTAEATLTSYNPPDRVYARTSGRLDSIIVKDNAMVEKGDPLAIIENTARYSDIIYLKSITDTLNIKQFQFEFPYETCNNLKLGSIAIDYASFENDLRNYQQLLTLKPYLVESEFQESELFQQQKRLRNLKDQLSISINELKLEKAKLDRNNKLFEKGVIAQQTLEEVELIYLQKQKNLSTIRNQISQVESEIINLTTNQKNTSINQTKDELNLYRDLLISFNQLKRSIRDWELQYVLESAIEGRLSYINYWRSRQFVNQGELVFSVIPKHHGKYIIRARTMGLNTGKLKVGQKALIRLSNYPDREFGVLEGVLTDISKTPDTDGFLVLDIKLPNQLETSFGIEIEFQQEMIGTAEIITEDLRLLERLMYQFRDLFRRSDNQSIDQKT
ncbi:HlyD family secretion protein [Flavobacterium sp. CS20]|jgi:multidrug resistance efflux pump|uniref:HlyD family secretion protein n=1 Tax=Flavobacterium sp. CS20 TaxID=2775246 RepID=UPI001B3A32F0|nr:HlyD family efflux transporter periplasmic adaptor subunit [Flavobacterium sp. CS20]QTY26330.1 HlyD family efflux transporter periplasmic adaptor subunit [Flavobacterium sp. CS20]